MPFPTPAWGESFMHDPGASRRGGANARLKLERLIKETSNAPSFRGDAKHRTRNLEIPGLVLRTIPE